jgi:ATP-dependent DNA helicase PIF1
MVQTQPSIWKYYQDIQLDETKLGLCEDKEPPNIKLILGRAGTGKSFQIKKKALLDPSYAILSAPTGIAAINLDSTTINSILGYFKYKDLQESYQKCKVHEKLYWLAYKYRNIVIDEASMLDGREIDVIIEAMADVNKNLPSGKGKLNLILTGDFAQLPPVNADYIFTANSWNFIKSKIEKLDKVYRQDNIIFLNALERCRLGDGYNTFLLLKSLGIVFQDKIDETFDGTTIFGTNEQIDFFNKKRFDAIDEKIIRAYPARRGILRKEWEYKVELVGNRIVTKGSIPLEMQFKKNSLVMLLTNDVPEFKYVNGDLGYIVDYKKPNIKIDDDYFTIRLKRNNEIIKIPRITRLNYTDKEPDQRLFSSMFHPYVDHLTHEWVIGSISYHPLRLAYASTVHKAQGLTLEKVQIDIRSYNFSYPHMIYVALSRAKTPDGLRIIGKKEDFIRKIKVDPRVKQWI